MFSLENKSKNRNRIFTKAQAALFLGISERTLSRYHAEGIGPPRIKYGGKVVYLEESLMEWLKSLERTSVRC